MLFESIAGKNSEKKNTISNYKKNIRQIPVTISHSLTEFILQVQLAHDLDFEKNPVAAVTFAALLQH